MPLGPRVDGAPRTVLRADLYDALRRRALDAGIPVHHGRRLAWAANGRDAVTAIFDDGTECSADLLVGADGLRSLVRELIDPRRAAAAPDRPRQRRGAHHGGAGHRPLGRRGRRRLPHGLGTPLLLRLRGRPRWRRVVVREPAGGGRLRSSRDGSRAPGVPARRGQLARGGDGPGDARTGAVRRAARAAARARVAARPHGPRRGRGARGLAEHGAGRLAGLGGCRGARSPARPRRRPPDGRRRLRVRPPTAGRPRGEVGQAHGGREGRRTRGPPRPRRRVPALRVARRARQRGPPAGVAVRAPPRLARRRRRRRRMYRARPDRRARTAHPARLGRGRAAPARRPRAGRSRRQRRRRDRRTTARAGGPGHRGRSGAGRGGRGRAGCGGRGGRGGRVPQRRRPRRRRQGRRARPAVPVLLSGARRAQRAADGLGRAPRPGAVPRLADLRGLPPRRGSPPHRRGRPAERLLGLRHRASCGITSSTRRPSSNSTCARSPRACATRSSPSARPPCCSWSATRSRPCRS